MKNKIFFTIFIGLFLAISLTLSIGMVAFGPSQAGANELLSAAPKWRNTDGSINGDFLSDLSDWIGDRFFLRQELITLDNRLTAGVFGSSGNDKVIAGKDGWLFFANTLPDYTGTENMSPRELFSAAKNVELMSRFCGSQGRKFAFFIALNKNSVYPANMPHYGVAAKDTNARQLMELLKGMNVKTVDLFAALEKMEEPLYFAHDSHWNSKGAALGADLINQALGVESSYFSGDFSQSEPHTGDLFQMLYPALQDTEENPVYGGKLNFRYTSKATKPDSITLQTEGSGQGSLLAYRDSFGNLLYPYLADSYGKCYFSRSAAYDLTREGDFVLIELVERNLSNLISSKNLPVMPSPVAETALPQTVSGTAEVSVSDKAAEGCKLVSGTLPGTPDTRSSVYVVCGGKTYEAFLLADDGYAAYVPENGEVEYLVYTADNQAVMFETTQK